MLIERFVVGPMAVNAYVVADEATRSACVIDPGGGSRQIKDFLRKRSLVLTCIVNTHGHGDHIAENARFNAPIYIHRLDAPFLIDAEKNLSKFFMFAITSPPASRMLEDAQTLEIGDLSCKVLHIPGHTPGGISLVCGGAVFAGDTLFAGGIGRTDFPYGDEAQLISSIREKLLSLPDETVVYPGHGDITTIGKEKRSNPFLA